MLMNVHSVLQYVCVCVYVRERARERAVSAEPSVAA